MGKGIVDKLKDEFSIRETWLPFEIHPETPPAGALLREHLPHIDWAELYSSLRQSGTQFDITFGEVDILSNSRKALEASEFARDQGRFEQFHQELFYCYFSEAQDIGSPQVLATVAQRSGLDTDQLHRALSAGKYAYRLDETTREAHRHGITSAPTFIIAEKYAIVGAQPIEVFREALNTV